MAAALLLGAALAAPAAAQQVLINEFNVGSPDYVELFNPTHFTVDVSGWTVQTYIAFGGVTPSPETPYTIPNGHVLDPFGFLVLQDNGTAGSPGSLPNSIHTGNDYNWNSTQTVEIVLFDDQMVGQDYVYLDWYTGPTAPHLPPNQNWIGDLRTGTGSDIRRLKNEDTDSSGDWLKTVGGGTPGDLNPGQSGCEFANAYGNGCPGTDGYVPTITSPVCPGIGEQADIYIENALGGALAFVFVGNGQGAFPLGGTGCFLNTSPPRGPSLILPLGGYGAAGGLATISFIAPPNVSGTLVTMQVMVKDPQASGGIANSMGSEFYLP